MRPGKAVRPGKSVCPGKSVRPGRVSAQPELSFYIISLVPDSRGP